MTDAVIRVVNTTSVVRVTQDDGTTVHVTNELPTVRVSSIGVQGIPGPRLVEVVYSVSGTVPGNRTITGYVASAPIEFIPADAVAIAGASNPVDTSATIKDLNDNVVGTVTFLAGAVVGTVTLSPLSLIKGGGLKFYHPATTTTLADLVVTLPANR